MEMVLEEGMEGKGKKDWGRRDKIGEKVGGLGFEVKERKDGLSWKLNK